MSSVLHDSMMATWQQVRFEAEYIVPSMNKGKMPKRRIPVSGIVCATTHSSPSLLVSALPQLSAAVIPPEWIACGIPNCLLPFDGPYLSSLGLSAPLCEVLRITPFASKVNQGALQASFAPKPSFSVNMQNEVISNEHFTITGICFRQQSNHNDSEDSFEFLQWTENQLQLKSAKDEYASFIVKAGKGVQTSFLGAPILTSGGKVESIVVHQRNVDDETVAIVGMQIASFANKYPTVLAPLSSI